MLTYPKSTMRVRRMPMHLSSGHVTLMPGKFSPFLPPPPNFPQLDLGRRADSRWALPQISRLLMFCYKFFVQREISEIRGPTGLKFCTMVSTRPNFIMPVQNFQGQKHAKFGLISDDFEVPYRISLKRMNIFKIGFLFSLPRFLLCWAKQVQ